MKQIVYIFLLFSALSFSQNATLSGRVADAHTKEPMTYAEISLQSSADKTKIFGAISDEKGKFLLKNLPKGNYLLKISFIGFQAITQNLTIEQSKTDLGTIFLNEISQNLDEIVVEGKRSALTYGVDRKTINASAFPEAHTAIDLLTNVPSLQVSVDGKVTYREGGSFSVYINGIAVKDGQERLRTLDASQIDKIEIITNPSARYGAEGTAGIIRVLLKKNKLEGYAINASANANTIKTYSFNYSIDKKGKKGGWHTSGNLNQFGQSPSEVTANNIVYGDTQIFESQQVYNGQKINRKLYMDFGFNYDLTERDYIDFSFGLIPFMAREHLQGDKQITENKFDLNRNLLDSQLFSIHEDQLFTYKAVDANIEYAHFFNDEKTHSLKLVSGFGISGDAVDMNKNTMTNALGSTTFGNKTIEKSDFYTQTELNYEVELTEKSSIEAGISIETDVIPEIPAESGHFQGDVIIVPSADFPTNQVIKFEENIYAGYFTFKSAFGDLEYKLGLRAENTDRDITLHYEDATGSHTDSYKANFTNWFPSVHLLYSFSESSQLTWNYSRRISRPNYWQLVPAFIWNDKYSYRTGNSRLLPTFTDSYEANYKKSWGKDFVSAEVFARNQHNNRGYIFQPFRDDILMNIPKNIGSSWAVGTELMTGVDIFPWWNVNASFTSFYFTQKTNVNDIRTDYKEWRLNGKLNQTFKLPHQFVVRLNTGYQSPQSGYQYDTDGYLLAEASLTKSLQEGRWQLSVSGWNIFDSYRYTSRSIDLKFDYRSENNYRPYITFSVKYQFNNQK